MPHYVTTRGLYIVTNAAFNASTDVRAAVMKGTTPSVASIRDLNFLSEVIATTWDEAAVAGYARATLAGKVLTEVDASDNVTFTATAPSMTSVAAGETWVAIAYYIFNASDAAAEVISIDVPSSPLITNGGNVTLPAYSLTWAAGAGS
jgi:hypothetical protein